MLHALVLKAGKKIKFDILVIFLHFSDISKSNSHYKITFIF